MAELTSTPSEQFSDNHETAPPRKGLKQAIKNAMPANIIFFTDGTKPGERHSMENYVPLNDED